MKRLQRLGIPVFRVVFFAILFVLLTPAEVIGGKKEINGGGNGKDSKSPTYLPPQELKPPLVRHLPTKPPSKQLTATEDASDSNSNSTQAPTPLPVCSFDAPAPFTVNAGIASIQQSATDMATLSAGPLQSDFVVTWQSVSNGSTSEIFASIFRVFTNDSVITLSLPFQVNTPSPFAHRSAQVSALPDGGFVIAFESAVPLNDSAPSITFQRILVVLFDRNGQPLGNQFQVAESSALYQDSIPRLTALKQTLNGFAISWIRYPLESNAGGQPAGTLYVRVFNSDGSPRTNPIAVNTILGDQVLPSHQISGLDSGDFVMSWASFAATSSSCESEIIAAQVFNNLGWRMGSQFQVSPFTANSQSEPYVQALTEGDLSFVISWTRGLEGGYSQIMFQLFDKNYAPFGGAQPVVQSASPIQSGSIVSNRYDGGFLVVWNDYNPTTGNFGIFGQLYDDRGMPLAIAPFQVGSGSGASQILPAALVSPINQVILTWTTSDNALLGQTLSCSYDCVVSDWTEWSQCSARCGGGQRGRIRNIITPAIQGGQPCPTDLLQTESCNEQPCPDPKCSFCVGESCYARISGEFSFEQAAQQCAASFCPGQSNCIANLNSGAERAFIVNNLGDGSDAWIASWQGNSYGGCLTMSAFGAIVIPQSGCNDTYQSVICEIPMPATC